MSAVYTTTRTVFGGYNRTRGLEVFRKRVIVVGEDGVKRWPPAEPATWVLQWYWTNGNGGRKYDPPLPETYATRKAADAARRELTAKGER